MAAEEPDRAAPGALFLVGLPERAIRQSLAFGFDYIEANPGGLRYLLGFTTEEELDRLLASNWKPHVHTAWPASFSSPLVLVLDTGEMPTPGGEYLGDVTALPGTPFQHRFGLRTTEIRVIVMTENPDLTRYLYRMIDQIVMSHDDWYLRSYEAGGAGLDRVEFISGGEIEIKMNFDPGRIWSRVYRLAVDAPAGAVLQIPEPAESIIAKLSPDGGSISVIVE